MVCRGRLRFLLFLLLLTTFLAFRMMVPGLVCVFDSVVRAGMEGMESEGCGGEGGVVGLTGDEEGRVGGR